MNEDLRLLAVKEFADRNLQMDAELQQLIAMASEICETPVALITLVDKDTQWLKVRLGTDVESTPVGISFCQHAIKYDGDVMVIPDMLADERFTNNPLVTDQPNLRFYAGAPLINRNGHKLGTLCVVDQKPHELNAHQHAMLKMLSKQAIGIMELKLAHDLLEKNAAELAEQKRANNEAEIRLRSFFENSDNFHVLLGKQGEIIDYNKKAYSFIKLMHRVKIKRGDILTRFIDPDFKETFLKNYDLALMGVGSIEEGVTNYGEHGTIYWEAVFEPARDSQDEIVGISYLIANITKRKLYEQRILKQNQSLMNIAHIQAHEFRGPLTSIMGMMNVIRDEEHNLPQHYIDLMDGALARLDDKVHEILDQVKVIVAEV